MQRGTLKFLFSYDASGNVVSVQFNGTEYYYLRNGQGDVVKLIDANGATVVEYTYDTWGKAVTTTGTLAGTLGLFQPFRYRGYVDDWETGFYYLQSRYYDPTTGRFISADILLSTGQGVLGYNAFAYCLDNPVNMVDDGGARPGIIEPPVLPPYNPPDIHISSSYILRTQAEIIIEELRASRPKTAKALEIAISKMDTNDRDYDLGKWDCSGFVNTVLWEFYPKSTHKGKGISGGTQMQYDYGKALHWEYGADMNDIQPGDLIYWDKNKNNKYNHVAIYIGYGLIIDNAVNKNISIHSIHFLDQYGMNMKWLRPDYENSPLGGGF